ncbi:hypothetical protein [Mycobacterium aquaticum]|uniref:Uncharacterized protein n=1 Tax=Mycobacterium aquaticum TaxID=1927124 RepID=A0A1X0ACJ3_9MYCO|nr:hypothetical protein [Mycobacterium aquaticum]ORA27406.1 hypothetical protein BST13_30590 [Mycobacterium aquaticum]
MDTLQDASTSANSVQVPNPRAQLRLLLLGVAVAGTVVVALVAAVVMLALPIFQKPPERGAARLASPVPPDREFAYINPVSQWPSDWTAAVCHSLPYEVRMPYARLPNATATAVCRARIRPNGDVVNVTIARFPAELPMQIDLLNDGYKWYAFAYDHGQMMAFATYSEVTVTDPKTNLGESPVLQPLKQFGFNVYSGPGP